MTQAILVDGLKMPKKRKNGNLRNGGARSNNQRNKWASVDRVAVVKFCVQCQLSGKIWCEIEDMVFAKFGADIKRNTLQRWFREAK